MKRKFILCSLISFLFFSEMVAQNIYSKSEREIESWRKDIESLKQKIKSHHPDLYNKISKDQFDQNFEYLNDQIPTASPQETLVEIARFVASIGDAHTSFLPADQTDREFNHFPFLLYSFPDGYYVIAASEEESSVIGKKLVRINETPIENAIDKISKIISADNEMGYEYELPFYIQRPEILAALNIANSPDYAEFTFSDGTSAEIRALNTSAYRKIVWHCANSLFNKQKVPDVNLKYLFATDKTWEKVLQGDYYWLKYFQIEKAIYLQYNQCNDQPFKPLFSQITLQLFAFLETHQVDRIIIDLRQNSQGSEKVAQPLIEGLSKWSQKNTQTKLFVLVGRGTFSAALSNAIDLKRKAGAIIVGEPPRGKPNDLNGEKKIKLKHITMYATVATRVRIRDFNLKGKSSLPMDIPVNYSFESFKLSQDPILEAALNTRIRNAGFNPSVQKSR